MSKCCDTHTHTHTHTPLLLLQSGTAEIDLKIGHVLKLSIEDKYKEIGDEKTIYVDYKNIVKVCVPGDIVFVDDGLISLKVTDKNSTSLTTGTHDGDTVHANAA